MLCVGVIHVSLLLRIPRLIELLFDTASVGAGSALWWQAGELLVVAILASVFAILLERRSVTLLARSIENIQVKMYRKALHLPYEEIERLGPGYLQARLREDTPQLAPLTVSDAVPYVVILVQCCVVAIILYRIDIYIAGAAVSISLVVGLTHLCAGAALKRMAAKSQEATAQVGALVNDVFRCIVAVKACAAELRELAHFKGVNHNAVSLRQSVNLANRLLTEFNAATGRLGLILIAAIGAIRINGGDMTASAFIASVAYVNILLYSSKSLINYIPQVTVALASLARVADFMNLPEEANRFGGVDLTAIDGDIIFESITFSHRSGKELFKNLSVVIPRGAKVAVVGPSGSGKSTLLKLMLGVYAPAAGRILIGKHDLSQVSLKSLRQRIGYMPQETDGVLRRSIRDNIALATTAIPFADIRTAAVCAHADQFIRRLPAEYGYVIGASGDVSGGERQRLMLAREIARKPDVLVIDEPTSQLDAVTESMVIATVFDKFRDATCVIVSHRVPLVACCDVIIVLNDGVIVDSGTHEELIAKGGLYRDLYVAQEHVSRSDTHLASCINTTSTVAHAPKSAEFVENAVG